MSKRFIRSRLALIGILTVLMALVLSGCVPNGDGTSSNIFILLIVRPFGYILRWIYDIVGSYGWAIIIFQLLAKIVMLPLSIKSKKGTMAQAKLQPKMQELEKRYKNDKQKYQEELSKLYQTEGVSPMSGCLPMLLTFPIMIGLYWPISQPLTYLMHLTADQINQIKTTLAIAAEGVVSEITVAQQVFENFDKVAHISENIIQMDMRFLGVNLGVVPDWKTLNIVFLFPIISAVTSFLLMKLTSYLQFRASGKAPANENASMTFMMPLMSLWIGFTLPAGLTLYWIAGNLTSMAQEYFMHIYMQRLEAKEAENPSPKANAREIAKKEAIEAHVQKRGSKRKKH